MHLLPLYLFCHIANSYERIDSLVSTAVHPPQRQAAANCAYVADFTQLTVTRQLIECVEEAAT
jgi:hypothetical protein